MANTTAGGTGDSHVQKSKCLHLPCLRRDRVCTISFLKHFSYKDLKKATDDFRRVISSHPQRITYEARFLDDSVCFVKEIAVADQAKDEFLKEVQLLGSLHHRHLVPLVGYSIGPRSDNIDMHLYGFHIANHENYHVYWKPCDSLCHCCGYNDFLVFEATGQGSLKQHLNDPLRTPLNWKKRIQIALGVAAALEYLYLFCDPPIYHVSISSSDILLDDSFTAKLSDISVIPSELPPSSNSEGSVQPPRNLIPKFGSLLLELITGQSSEKGSGDVIEWVQESHLDISMHNMIDPDLGDSYDLRMLRHLLNVARLCIKAGEKPSFSISHVFWYLQAKVCAPEDYH